MKNLTTIIFIFTLTQFCLGQKIKKKEIFRYEFHYDDTASYDTILVEVDLFDINGKRYQSISFNNNGDIIEETILQGDSLRLIFINGSSNTTTPIKYYYDNNGENSVIISTHDTIQYENFYSDSNLVKQISNSEGRNVAEYFYNENNKRIMSIQYAQQKDSANAFWAKKDTLITKWEYDEKDRVIKWFPGYSGGYIKYEYKENPKEIHTIYTYKSNNEEYERTIEVYNEKDIIVKKELYIDKKLYTKELFKTFYYKD